MSKAIMVHSASGEIQQLLSHRQLWRAGKTDRIDPAGQRISSGYARLDKILVGGGWPRDGLVELLADRMGIGEIRLIAPALAALSQEEQRWLAWINPPHLPYAPALSSLGIAIDKVLLVHPECHEDALWSMEQALKSGTCSVALGWFDDRRLTVKDLRRLQLAARQGGTLTILFRPLNAARHSTMAELRIVLSLPESPPRSALAENGLDLLQLELTKRRGGWPVAPFLLQLQGSLAPLTAKELHEHIECWRVRARNWQTAPPAQLKVTASAREPGVAPLIFRDDAAHVRRA
jgi:protein ImuA